MTLSLNSNLLAVNSARTLGNHYSRLATSVQRLSSGLRINSAADDAAGLAIRELMRTDIAAIHQGIRNANDAISMIQTADGALSVIDEKLIRMKELAEQAATGTYDSTQRLIIDSEFQAMGAEIDRIARATDFNGIKLLDGSLSGTHDGEGLTPTGAMKIHFGTGNDSAEDYYYMEIGDCTCAGLGLTDGRTGTGAANTGGTTTGIGGGTGNAGTAGSNLGNIPILSTVLSNGSRKQFSSHGLSIAVIPKGTQDLNIYFNDGGIPESLQIFTSSGKHLVGTTLNSFDWSLQFAAETGEVVGNITRPIENWGLIPIYGFDNTAIYDSSDLNGINGNLVFTSGTAGNTFIYNGMAISYSGDGNPTTITTNINNIYEYLNIDNVTEDLILAVAGDGPFVFESITWTSMPTSLGGTGGTTPGTPGTPATTPAGDLISIKTQDLAQKALERIDDAIVKKDNVRAHLGALQNRLENTVTNLAVQAENLQASESRISDTDVATEMTEFVRNQILTQSATAMLAQANSLPQMLAGLLEG